MRIKPFQLTDQNSQDEPAIDRATIVKAALALLDEVGLDGLTMRSLAKKLGIKASSLYWHLRSKQELLDLLAEEICMPISEPDQTLPWFDRLVTLGNGYRQALLLHRDAARVLASSGGPSGPKRLRLAEFMLRTLLDAGFDQKDAAYAGILLNNYVLSSTAEEARETDQPPDRATETPGLNVQNWMEALPQNDFPSLISLSQYLAAPDADESFRFGLQILRHGLEQRLVQSRGDL